MKVINFLKFVCLFLGLFFFASMRLNARCMCGHYHHHNKNVVRCAYTQEDIVRMHKKYTDRHVFCGCKNMCIYCGCPLEYHTTQAEEEGTPLQETLATVLDPAYRE